MRDLPSSVSSAATYVPSRQSIMSFSVMIGSGVFFIMLAFTVFLPMIIVAPQKFAICFTLGCIFIMGAFFALKGPKSQALHMISKEVRVLSDSAFEVSSTYSYSSLVRTTLCNQCNYSGYCRGCLLPWGFLEVCVQLCTLRWFSTATSFRCFSPASRSEHLARFHLCSPIGNSSGL